jgi:hypothetical protein
MYIIKSTFGGMNSGIELYPFVLPENTMLTKLLATQSTAI